MYFLVIKVEISVVSIFVVLPGALGRHQTRALNHCLILEMLMPVARLFLKPNFSNLRQLYIMCAYLKSFIYGTGCAHRSACSGFFIPLGTYVAKAAHVASLCSSQAVLFVSDAIQHSQTLAFHRSLCRAGKDFLKFLFYC